MVRDSEVPHWRSALVLGAGDGTAGYTCAGRPCSRSVGRTYICYSRGDAAVESRGQLRSGIGQSMQQICGLSLHPLQQRRCCG